MNSNPILINALDEIYSDLLLSTSSQTEDLSIPFNVFCQFTWQQFQANESQTAQLVNNVANDSSMKITHSLLLNILDDLIEHHFPIRQIKKRQLTIQNLAFFEIHSPENLLLNLLAVGLQAFNFSDTQLSLFLFDTSLPNSLELVFCQDDPLSFFEFDFGVQFLKNLRQNIKQQIETIIREQDGLIMFGNLGVLKNALKLVCNTRTPLRNNQQSGISLEFFSLFVETGFVDFLVRLLRNILESPEKSLLTNLKTPLFELFTIFCSFFRFELNFNAYQISLSKCNLSSDFIFKLVTSLISTLVNLFITGNDLGAFKALVAILGFSKKILSGIPVSDSQEGSA